MSRPRTTSGSMAAPARSSPTWISGPTSGEKSAAGFWSAEPSPSATTSNGSSLTLSTESQFIPRRRCSSPRSSVPRADFPELAVPNRPSGVVGVYDVADDWSPIYDRTDLPGFYVAIGTSGNQFKNAPVVGQLMATLISEVEAGADHDTNPVTFVTPRAGLKIDLAAFSRRRPRNNTTGTVLG